jgi:hypothetical protein
MGEDRDVSATWLTEPHITDGSMCGDYAVSFLQDEWRLLQRLRGDAWAIQRGLRSKSSAMSVVASNRPSESFPWHDDCIMK